MPGRGAGGMAFTHSLIHPFIHSVNSYFVPKYVPVCLSTGHTAVNKTKHSCPNEAYSTQGS